MELRHYLTIVGRRWLFVVIMVVVAVAASYLRNQSGPATYSASATIYVGASRFNSIDTVNLNGNSIAGLDRITNTFAEMIRSEPVAREALDTTPLPRSPSQVVGETTAAVRPGTNLITISVTDTDPTIAQSLANGIADALVSQVATLESRTSATDTSSESPSSDSTSSNGATGSSSLLPQAPAEVFERAGFPTTPVTPDVIRPIVIGALLGLILAVGIVLLLDYLDVTVKSVADAERTMELPVLGVIPVAAVDDGRTRREARVSVRG